MGEIYCTVKKNGKYNRVSMNTSMYCKVFGGGKGSKILFEICSQHWGLFTIWWVHGRHECEVVQVSLSLSLFLCSIVIITTCYYKHLPATKEKSNSHHGLAGRCPTKFIIYDA